MGGGEGVGKKSLCYSVGVGLRGWAGVGGWSRRVGRGHGVGHVCVVCVGGGGGGGRGGGGGGGGGGSLAQIRIAL